MLLSRRWWGRNSLRSTIVMLGAVAPLLTAVASAFTYKTWHRAITIVVEAR